MQKGLKLEECEKNSSMFHHPAQNHHPTLIIFLTEQNFYAQFFTQWSNHVPPPPHPRAVLDAVVRPADERPDAVFILVAVSAALLYSEQSSLEKIPLKSCDFVASTQMCAGLGLDKENRNLITQLRVPINPLVPRVQK